MSKSTLVTALSEHTGGSKAEAERYVEAFTKSVEEIVRGGGEVRLQGFGTFKLSRRAGGEARNPQTQETITYGPSERIGFKGAKL